MSLEDTAPPDTVEALENMIQLKHDLRPAGAGRGLPLDAAWALGDVLSGILGHFATPDEIDRELERLRRDILNCRDHPDTERRLAWPPEAAPAAD